jgi:hypothetical protein
MLGRLTLSRGRRQLEAVSGESAKSRHSGDDQADLDDCHGRDGSDGLDEPSILDE